MISFNTGKKGTLFFPNKKRTHYCTEREGLRFGRDADHLRSEQNDTRPPSQPIIKTYIT